MEQQSNSYIERARQCFRLALWCDDDEATDRIIGLGRELLGKAVAAGAAPESLPRPPYATRFTVTPPA